MRSLLTAALTLAAAAGFVAAESPAAAPVVAPVAAPVPALAATADESEYTPLAPVRVLDTRAGTGTGGATAPVGPARTISLNLAARVPAGTTAVVLNVTGVAPTAATYVTVFPTGEARPLASNLNLARAEIRANLVTVRVTGTRTVSLYNHAGSTHLVADLAGYYSTNGGSRFTPTDEVRRFSTILRPRESAPLDFSDAVPASATAVVLNVTGVRPTLDTFLTVWPTGTTRPGVSNVNLAAGKVNPNLVTVAIGTNRQVSVYNSAGDITVHADLAGFYTPEYGAVFAPRTPARVFDSRTGVGLWGGKPARLGPWTTSFHPGSRVPDTAIAALTNLTGVAPTASTYLTATLGTPGPWNSNLNLVAGQTAANLAVVPVMWRNPDERAYFYNHSGNVDLIGDLAGYFWVPPGGCVADCAYSWGYDYGNLGTGTTTSESFTPTQLAGLSGVTQVVDTYALRSDGTVWAWGPNSVAQLGNGWIGSRSTVPVRVRGLTGVVAVAAAATNGLALRSDGTVWAWGAGDHGLLGTPLGSTQPAPDPVRVPGLENVTAIAAGFSTGYALRSDGTVVAWGQNDLGQLGDGTTTGSPAPVPVSGLTGVTSIAAGGRTGYAVLADGTVRVWGENHDGQAGDGSSEPIVTRPVPVSGLTGVTTVSADFSRAFALRTDGTVLAWGSNHRGGLGDGVDCGNLSGCVVRTPVTVAAPAGVVDIAANGVGGYALDGAGRVWAWGSNHSGELGHARLSEFALTPVQVPNLPVVDSLGYSRTGARLLVSAP